MEGRWQALGSLRQLAGSRQCNAGSSVQSVEGRWLGPGSVGQVACSSQWKLDGRL